MTFKSVISKTSFTSLLALGAFLPMSACDLANNHTKIDRSTNSEFQDYRDAMAPREANINEGGVGQSGVPEVESYVSDGSQNLKSSPLVSLSINQSIPLREALFELVKQADYDVELDPRISGSIIFTARNRPFDEVIDRICEISGLRYKFDENTLRIEIDSPYSKSYKVDYLSFVRKNTSSVKTDVSIASSGATTTNAGSTFAIDSTSDADFWAELDTNLKQILSSNSSPSYLKTNEDPQISLTSSNPTPPAVPAIDGAALSDTAPQAGSEDFISSPVSVPQNSTTTTTTTTSTQPAAAATVAVPPSSELAAPAEGGAVPVTPAAEPSSTDAPTPQPVAAQAPIPAQPPVLRVESLPTSLSGTATGVNAVQFTPAFSMNKQAGIISVYANERLHKQVESYLKDLRRSTTSQVLIEAKVLEVTLSDEFATGIDWTQLESIGDFSISGITFPKPSFTPTTSNTIRFGFAGNDISAFVSALSRFGTVHALASPRLTVLNNQAAVLNVAKNQVYFELDITVTAGTTTSAGQTTVESEIKSVPEGVLINVLPSIDLDKRTISMQVRPSITKIDSFVSDPGVAFASASLTTPIESLIPIMNVQEVDSVLNMNDKQMMVMGGLLQDTTSSEQQGVPVASEVPILGGLFRNQNDKVSKKELVIFMKATILDEPEDSIHQTDKDLYRVFGQDRRPSKL
jgi:MSHA type pilus biogenesis protein MshL